MQLSSFKVVLRVSLQRPAVQFTHPSNAHASTERDTAGSTRSAEVHGGWAQNSKHLWMVPVVKKNSTPPKPQQQ